MGEAGKRLIELQKRFAPNMEREATIPYGSEYAYGLATRLTRDREIGALSESMATWVSSVPRAFSGMCTVIPGFEVADKGAMGRVSPACRGESSATASPGSKESESTTTTSCSRCGRTPVGTSPAAADAVVPRLGRHPLVTCSRCNVQPRNCDLPQHQPDCRGPGGASRTCKYCQTVLGSVMPRKNHARNTHSEESLRDGGIGKLSNKRSGV